MSEEWPRVGNGPGSEIRNNPSSLVEKNGADSLLLIFYVEGKHSFRSHRCEWKIGPDDCCWYYILRADTLSRSHRCEWKIGPDVSFFIITLFLCRWRLLWWQDILSDLTDVSEKLAQMIQFYHNIVYMQVAICYEGQFVILFHKVWVVVYYWNRHRCVL